MNRFTDRVLIVTGGASGIGKSCVNGLLNEGARVVAVDRDHQALGNMQAHDSLLKLELDLVEHQNAETMVSECVRTFGQLDGAVNCAGVLGPYGNLEEVTPEDWNALINDNLNSLFYSLKHEIKALKQNGEGSIVNISSALGIAAMAMAGPYVASKHAIIGLTKTAALELAESNIRVNAIAPGAVDTPLFRATTGSTPEGLEAITNLHPQKRISQPEEIASAALFLLSDESKFITGATVPVDGGWTVP